MQFVALASGLLFASSLTLTFADAAWAASRESAPVARAATAQNVAKQTLSYGKDKLQKVDFWASTQPNAPLVIFVHGGGWKRGDKQMMDGSAKLRHWRELGYAVASVNYRLVPEHTVEEQAADVSAAVALLKLRAHSLGFDPRRMALVGHSAGAHLVALVGTDPSYFRAAGLTLNDVKGIVPLDGAAYDVATQISDGGNFMHDTYIQAFGTDSARQKRLSPTMQAASPNAPEFLILHVQRADGTAQSNALGAALNGAGTPAKVQGFKGRGLKGHAEINRKLGEKTYPATPVVDAFFARIFR